jgi:hypothetical protein
MAWAGTRLIAGNDGGVWSTTTNGDAWTNHNSNLAITQFYYGSLHPKKTTFALAGGQDNGTDKWTWTNTSQKILNFDGGDNAISSSQRDAHWAVSSQNLEIYRTTNGGSSFVKADTGINDNRDNNHAPFIGRLDKCAANSSVFIAGTDNLWRNNNFFFLAGPTSPDWFSNSPEMGVDGNGVPFHVTALAFCRIRYVCILN